MADKDVLVFLLFGTDSLDYEKLPVYLLIEFYFVADPENGVRRKTHPEMVECFKQFCGPIKPDAVYVDIAEPAFIEILKRSGFRAKS